MAGKQDYYSLLGIERDATAEEIRQAYFSAARRLHPDTNAAPGETELFIGIQEAYETLSNPKKRAKYDTSLPPEQTTFLPVDQRILFSRSNLLNIDEPQLVYSLLEITPKPETDRAAASPINLCFVIDRSTSMQGHSMDMVKTTAIQISRRLKEKDYFALVAFSDRAEIVIPSESGSDAKKLEARIQMIQCSGGTEIFTGLEAGYNEVMRTRRNSASAHIILLTDGRTYGDEEKCLQLARRAADERVFIRGLGIGAEWNDTFLDELAAITGGNSMFISRPEDIQRILLEKINQLSNTYAQMNQLDFTIPDRVTLNYAFRISPDPALLPVNSPLRMGSVQKDYPLSVLLEFMVHSTENNENLTLLDGRSTLIMGDTNRTSVTYPLKIRRPVRNEASKDPPAPEIVSALSKLTLYRLQEQARLEASAGDYEKASENLQRLATHLLACGERGLAHTALLEAEHLHQQKTFSQKGQKEIKYGTRALILPRERK